MEKGKKKKKASNKIVNFFESLIIILVLISTISQLTEIIINVNEYYKKEDKEIQSISIKEKIPTLFKKEDYIGSCKVDIFEEELNVFLTSDNLPIGVEGRFVFIKNRGTIIILKGSNYINVVSHEVIHYVDSLTKFKGIDDMETRAYLQGYLTECVIKLINK